MSKPFKESYTAAGLLQLAKELVPRIEPLHYSPIDGVVILRLVTHDDDRGFFREIFSTELPSGEIVQVSHSMMTQGTIKAWHLHKEQTDYWYVPIGRLKVGLVDLREGSPTEGQWSSYYMDYDQDPFVLKIPPGVAHGCKCIIGPAHLIYATNKLYNPNDEWRIPYLSLLSSEDLDNLWRDPPVR